MPDIADTDVIALLLLYGNVVHYNDGRIIFNLPNNNSRSYAYSYSYAGSILYNVRTRMMDAVLCIESEK